MNNDSQFIDWNRINNLPGMPGAFSRDCENMRIIAQMAENQKEKLALHATTIRKLAAIYVAIGVVLGICIGLML